MKPDRKPRPGARDIRRATIKGERTRTRITTRTELPVLAKWWTDPAVMKPMAVNSGVRMSPDEWNAWFRSWCGCTDTSRCHFTIFDEHDVPIGEIYYHDLDSGNRRAAIGAKIGLPDLWGKGYAPDAVNAFCTYMFNTIHVRELVIEVVPTNSRALAFWKKTGFVAYARSTDTINMRLRVDTFHSRAKRQSAT
jgi:RimJ/RimL family protein N-acetyltransferase